MGGPKKTDIATVDAFRTGKGFLATCTSFFVTAPRMRWVVWHLVGVLSGSELLCRLSVTTSFSAARTELAIHRLILSLPLGHQLVQQMYGRHHFERMVWVFGSVWKSMAVQHVTRLECHSSQCKHGVFKRVCPRRKTRPKPTSMLRRGDPGTHETHGIGVGPSLPCETSVV